MAADGYFPIVYEITVVAGLAAFVIAAIAIAAIAIAVYHFACVAPFAPVADFEPVVKFTVVVPPFDVYDIAGVDYVAVVTLLLILR